MNVFFEAILVGLALLPIFWAVEKLKLSKWATVFVAGAAFHLIAEATGVNAMYAKMK